MEIKASLNYLRISPRKVKLVADLIRGLNVDKAQAQLQFLTKKAASPILKLLNSAIANAKHNFNLEKENLYIEDIGVNQGSTLKRWRPRAFGRAAPILRRTSHVTIILGEAKKMASIPKMVSKTGEMEGSKGAQEAEEQKKKVKPKFQTIKEIGKKRLGAAKRIFQRKAI